MQKRTPSPHKMQQQQQQQQSKSNMPKKHTYGGSIIQILFCLLKFHIKLNEGKEVKLS